MTVDNDKISGIYQQGREQGTDQNPPVHLDNAILKAAHEAVERDTEGQPASGEHAPHAKSPFSGSWPATVSIAAVLIITVILVPLIEQDTPEHLSVDVPVDVPADAPINVPAVSPEVLRRNIQLEKASELKSLQTRQEKTKKRQILNSPAVRSEKQSQINAYELLPESDSYDRQPTAEEKKVPEWSSAPAAMPMAAGKMDLQRKTPQKKPQKTPEAASSGQQSGLLMMDSLSFSNSMQSDKLSPQRWLEKIRQLAEKGKLEAAKKELEAFRLSFPDEKIDQDILDLLNEN